jgi:hypothetical protein
MTEPTLLTVTLDFAGPDAAEHQTVLASLPGRFRVVTGPVDIAVVSGRSGGLSRALGQGQGTNRPRAVVVSSPAALSPADREALDAYAAAGGLVAPALRFASKLPQGMEDPASFTLVSSVATYSDATPAGQRQALLEQLALVRMVAGAVSSLTACQQTECQYNLQGSVEGSGAILTLAGIVSPIGANEIALTAAGASVRLEVEIAVDAVARPARCSRFTSEGEQVEAPVHQNGYRLLWQSVRESLVVGGSQLDYGVAELAADLVLLRHAS